jgi:tRNA pseudouridine38-40 synthase
MEQISEKPGVPMASDNNGRDGSGDNDRKRKRNDRDGGRGRGRGGRPLQHGSHQHKKRNMGRKEYL